MKRYALAGMMLLFLLTAAGAGEKQKTVKLLEANSLEGWTAAFREEGTKLEDVFTLQDGVLDCTGRPVGYIRTKDKYTSYVLTLQWRFDPAKGPGNSGVLLRQVGEDKVWPKSVEAQLHHQNAGDIWNIDKFPMTVDESRTKGRRTVKMKETNEKPLGEWNNYKIVLDGEKLELYVNGELQNTATDVEVVPGHICLQSEGAAIQFRNLEVTPIEK